VLPGSFDKPDRGDVALPDQAVPEHDKIDELKALSQVKEGLSGVRAGQRRPLREGWGNGIPAKPDLTAYGHRALDRPERDPAAFDTGLEEQMSLFAALSAVATDHQTHAPFESGDDVDDDLDASFDDDDSLLVDLGPPPPLAGDRRFLDDARAALGDDAATNARTRAQQKKRLRERNAELVAVLVRRTGQTHPQINSELNRLSGIDRISEATVRQLEKRLEVAERLARG